MTERGTLWLVNMYVRKHIQLCPEILVLFGDNIHRKGMGGQAKECRHEPNVLGIPVKERPSTLPGAYFTDGDIARVGRYITPAFHIARDALLRGQDVAYPFSGVGTGRAELNVRAPKIMSLIHEGEKMLRESCRRQIRADNLYLVRAHLVLERVLPKDSED